MFIKKFISISAIFVLLFTLVANTVCCADYVYPLGEINVKPEGYGKFPCRIRSIDAENNKKVNLIFSVESDNSEPAPGYVAILGHACSLNDYAEEGRCKLEVHGDHSKLEFPVSGEDDFSRLFNSYFEIGNHVDNTNLFKGVLRSNVKLNLEKIDSSTTITPIETVNSKDVANAVVEDDALENTANVMEPEVFANVQINQPEKNGIVGKICRGMFNAAKTGVIETGKAVLSLLPPLVLLVHFFA